MRVRVFDLSREIGLTTLRDIDTVPLEVSGGISATPKVKECVCVEDLLKPDRKDESPGRA